jgi:hypothetical protein
VQLIGSPLAVSQIDTIARLCALIVVNPHCGRLSAARRVDLRQGSQTAMREHYCLRIAKGSDRLFHVDIPTLDEFKALALARSDVCVSLYAPTIPAGEMAPTNRTTVRELADEALSRLKETHLDKRRIGPIEEHIRQLVGIGRQDPDADKPRLRQQREQRHHDPERAIDEFWRFQSNGVAVLATPENMRVFRLANQPKALVDVADRFHLTPLLHAMTSPHDILVLALAEESVRVIHAFVNHPPIRIYVQHLPKNAEEATRRPSIDSRSPHRRLQGSEGQKLLLYKYARTVDQVMREGLAGERTPMALAAAEPLASIYRAVNSYPHLLDTTIIGSPVDLTDAQIADAALPILTRLHERSVAAVIALYDEGKPERATTDISEAARAATIGAIAQLVVDLNSFVPGRVSDTGAVSLGQSETDAYSVIDEVAKRAVCSGADVQAADRDELPDHVPLVAILRYPITTE